MDALTPADRAWALGRLVLAQAVIALPIAAVGGPPLGVGLGVAWATSRWVPWAFADPDFQVRPLARALAEAAPGTLVVGAVAAGLGAGLWGIPAALIGAALGPVAQRVLRFPRMPGRSSGAEAWAREHRDDYRGQATRPGGVALRPSYDPHALFTGSSQAPKPPPDPWDDAYGTGHQEEA
ncbi:MAG: hypothetical protein ACI8PZ_000397 [Myxococcota bacterium]|jgi:hypothetical protein